MTPCRGGDFSRQVRGLKESSIAGRAVDKDALPMKIFSLATRAPSAFGTLSDDRIG